jgi:hypothetical protein
VRGKLVDALPRPAKVAGERPVARPRLLRQDVDEQRVPLGGDRDNLLVHRREQLGQLAGARVRVRPTHRAAYRGSDGPGQSVLTRVF